MKNQLYYGDNLDVLQRYLTDESVDLCYIDPPFNSQRKYYQIYHHRGPENRAQAQAFIDTWVWDARADQGFAAILANDQGRFTVQTVDLLKGLQPVLQKGSLLAYLVSMVLRLAEIHRVLKPTGSLYLHCNPTASHYLKLVLDAIFIPHGGNFLNEIVWGYSLGGKSKRAFGRKHDIIFIYTKSIHSYTFNLKGASIQRKPHIHMRSGYDADGRPYYEKTDRKSGKTYRYYADEGKIAEDYWTDIETLNRGDGERLGYPTQKPEALLERIIQTSSNEGDVVLDAYCGCGTTPVVAQRFKRNWIGIDITYQSIALVLGRLEGAFGAESLANVMLRGIPQSMEEACALALQRDMRVYKEFEKWAVLTYTDNRAIIQANKNDDQGINGIAFFSTGKNEHAKIIFRAISSAIACGEMSRFNCERIQEGAELAVCLTLQPPTLNVQSEARMAGMYKHDLLNRSCPRIQIVTIAELIEQCRRIDVPVQLRR